MRRSCNVLWFAIVAISCVNHNHDSLDAAKADEVAEMPAEMPAEVPLLELGTAQ